MPPFGDRPAEVTRIWRIAGFIVDETEPLFEVRLGRTHPSEPIDTMIVRAHRDGTIYDLKVWEGGPVSAGQRVVLIGGMGLTLGHGAAVFMSYRQADSLGHTGRLYDGLIRDLGRHQVFRDFGSLRPGIDFIDHISGALQRTRVLVLVIGPNWLDARDHAGARRLENPDDLHRVEIRTAITRGIPIVPVLVGGATMPRRDQLPEDLQPMVRRHAITMSETAWEADAEVLRRTLLDLLRPYRPPHTLDP